jgi:PEP-CTERM motif
MHATLLRWLRVAGLATLIGAGAGAQAGPIAFDTFLQFGFSGAGVPATGCDPADPAGPFCIPSSGTPTFPLDAPPWTFTGAALLTITDAFESGDRFEVFDFGVSLGLTSASAIGTDCGDDPVPCLANAAMSHGSFALGAGQHSITIVAVDSPSGGGAAYLIAALVPEPSSLLLLAIGAIAWRLRGRRSA